MSQLREILERAEIGDARALPEVDASELPTVLSDKEFERALIESADSDRGGVRPLGDLLEVLRCRPTPTYGGKDQVQHPRPLTAQVNAEFGQRGGAQLSHVTESNLEEVKKRAGRHGGRRVFGPSVESGVMMQRRLVI